MPIIIKLLRFSGSSSTIIYMYLSIYHVLIWPIRVVFFENVLWHTMILQPGLDKMFQAFLQQFSYFTSRQEKVKMP